LRKKRHNTEEEGGAKWLTTFNDLVTLLLTFFVLVLSVSKIDASKVQEVVKSMRETAGMIEVGDLEPVQIFIPFVRPKFGLIKAGEKKRTKLANDIDRISGIDAKAIEEGVLITLGEKILFETGKAQFKSNNMAIDSLGSIILELDCPVRVEGHTDNIPIHNEQFVSNWELSMARAVAVVKYLISECGIAPEKLSATGYADSRSKVPNNADHNRELNRRVEIILSMQD